MAYTANKTELYYVKNITDAKELEGLEFTKQLEFLMEVPELGGSVEKIDVTSLQDTVKKYIPGIKDYGDLVFKFIYDNSKDDSNYRVLKDMDDNGTTSAFKIAYPDGTAHAFTAIPSVKLDAGALNGALTFSATMMLQSDIEITNPSDDESTSTSDI